MISSIKLLIALVIVLILSYIGWDVYRYYFVISKPTVTVIGIEPEGSYSGDKSVVIKGQDEYKIGGLTVKIDDKPFLAAKIGRKSFEFPFTLQTKTLSQGKHVLEVEVENKGHTVNKANTTLVFYVNNQPLQAAFVKNESDAKVPQGRTVHVQFQTSNELKQASIKALAKSYPCFKESERGLIYECFIPIETEEAPGEYLMTVEAEDRVGNLAKLEGKFQVTSFPFKRQTIKIDPEKLKAENEAGLSEKQFETEVEELTRKSPHEKLWHGAFVTPIEIKDPKQITTEYGVIRVTQERGLRQHKALDLYTTPKSVVWAPQDGIMVMKNRFSHSGNTVIIDHGWGILSLFFHLDSFGPFEVGDTIKKGNPVGTLGKTGYATGYHLHWEMRVGNVAIDPMEWTKPGF